jgi:hypothetical protein
MNGLSRPTECQLLSVAAMVGICLGVTAAHAQLQPEMQLGSRIPVKPTKFGPVELGQMRKSVGRCAFGTNPVLARRIAEVGDPASVALESVQLSEKALGHDLALSRCMGGKASAQDTSLALSYDHTVLRSMLVEEIYLDSFPIAPSLPNEAAEKTDRNFVSEGDKLVQAKGLGAIEDCVTFNDTANADALLRTMPGSPQERVTAKALAPALSHCLSSGVQISLTPSSIRNMMADGLWNRYVRPKSAVSRVTK